MIRSATIADFSFIHSIASNPENAKFIVDVPRDKLLSYIEQPDIELVIWEHEEMLSGFALFCEIGDPSGRTELRRLGLANKGAGLGRFFLRDLIDYAFDKIGVNRIWLDVVADNPRAQAVYHRAGFKHEGTLRQNWQRPDGDVVDMQVFGMLKAERPDR